MFLSIHFKLHWTLNLWNTFYKETLWNHSKWKLIQFFYIKKLIPKQDKLSLSNLKLNKPEKGKESIKIKQENSKSKVNGKSQVNMKSQDFKTERIFNQIFIFSLFTIETKVTKKYLQKSQKMSTQREDKRTKYIECLNGQLSCVVIVSKFSKYTTKTTLLSVTSWSELLQLRRCQQRNISKMKKNKEKKFCSRQSVSGFQLVINEKESRQLWWSE